MIPQATQRIPRRRRLAAVGATLAVLIATGCSSAQQRGFLPGHDDGQVTNQTQRITDLWVGSWIALVVVGLIVWGLTIWCAVAYRRRKDDTGFPIQLRYHVPLELMFTLLPVVMVLTFFYFTQRDIREIEAMEEDPYVVVNAVGKQWSWDFTYTLEDQVVHEPAGVQSFETGTPGAAESLPVLYLPEGETVEFRLDSRDVIHSFWIVDFLYKKDMFPGHTSSFQVTPTREGTYMGKCAELCGEYHSDMLFTVEVIPVEEFEAHLDDLEQRGLIGPLGIELNRNQSDWTMRDSDAEGVSDQNQTGTQEEGE